MSHISSLLACRLSALARGPRGRARRRRAEHFRPTGESKCLDRQGHSQLLLLQRRRQGLLELVGLALVGHDEGVQVRAASDLELGGRTVLLYLDGLGVLAPGDLQELANLSDLL